MNEKKDDIINDRFIFGSIGISHKLKKADGLRLDHTNTFPSLMP